MASADSQPARLDESDTVARAARGDVAAFEALYRATAGRVYALCIRLTGDRQAADEALQDVYVRIWEKLAQFKGESSFATWVHRLCVNQLLETRRKDSRREARVVAADLSVHDAMVPRGEAADSDTRLDLERALPRLSPGARQVFVLHDVQGYEHTEIAKLLGIAESTVRVQLHRARKQLMEVLER
ncbi:MAG: RNA polymerase sigma factor [Gemmatimonadaceae bacterium]